MENRRENFHRISSYRAERIVKDINGLRNFMNTSFYEYTDEEIDAMFDDIQKALTDTRNAFERKKGKKRNYKL